MDKIIFCAKIYNSSLCLYKTVSNNFLGHIISDKISSNTKIILLKSKFRYRLKKCGLLESISIKILFVVFYH